MEAGKNLMKPKIYWCKLSNSFLIVCISFAVFFLAGCANEPEPKTTRKPVDYIKAIPGVSDSIPVEVSQKGEVLIAYSDCYTCHTKDKRAVGPAFKDVAKRYPANKVYIEMLAQKVIAGGRGSWGYPAMDPHPKLSVEDAKLMVTYILSLRSN